jgi:hypothetical protein
MSVEGMRHVVSGDSHDRMGEQQSPQSSDGAVYVEPDTGDDTGDDDLRMLPADHVPRQLSHSPQNMSTNSSLSDGSGGLLRYYTPDDIESPTGAMLSAVVSQIRRETPAHVGEQANMVVMHPAGRQLRAALHRMDSGSSGSVRGNSQTSSNDWGYGWYDDVHMSSEGTLPPFSNKKPQSSPGRGKRGLASKSTVRSGQEEFLMLHKDTNPGECMCGVEDNR